jgi:hypothetical protein
MDAPSQAAPKNLHGSNARFEQTVLLLQGGGALASDGSADAEGRPANILVDDETV